MTISLWIELAKACIFMLIGAFLCSHFKTSDEPATLPAIAQQQASKCFVKKSSVIAPDGTKTESLEFQAESQQAQEIKPTSNSSMGLGIALFSSKAIQLRYELNKNFSLIGRLQDLTDIKSTKELGIEIRF